MKKILKLKHFKQSTDYTCGPATVLSFLHYYDQKYVQKSSEKTIARLAKTCSLIGTTKENLHRVIQQQNNNFILGKENNIHILKKQIDANHPSVVLWHDDEEWHWSNVIGYDKHNIILLDPYLEHELNFVQFNKFEKQWSKTFISHQF